MTVTLYKWTTKEEFEQAKRYFARTEASGGHLLGYLINTGFYDLDKPGDVNMWTSHPDPLNTDSVVVWFFESAGRIRIYVSAETRLDRAEFTPEAFQQAILKDKSKLPDVPYFKSQEDELFYRQSLEVFEDHFVYFISQLERKHDLLFHHINLLWAPMLWKHIKIDFDGPCYKFVKNASDPLTKIQLPDHLTFSTLDLSDTDIVRDKNKVTYPYDYVRDCLRLSTAIRTKETHELAAWTMTHRDMTVGALHVLPEHRRQKLAEAVLTNISKTYQDHYHRQLPDVPLSQLYFSACVETYNTPSYNLFKKSGWTLLGIGCTWIHTP